MGLIFIATILHCICMTNAVPVESKTCEGCNCTDAPPDFTVDCSSRSLPNPLPSNLTKLLLYNSIRNRKREVNLNLKNNYIDLSDKKNLFDHLQKLRILDVSYNKISIIPHTIFDKLILLEKLSLKGNTINDFSVNLIPLKNLRLLDLSDNQLSFLSETVTRQLDTIRATSNLTLDITGNPIICSCDVAKLKFIRWLIQTNVTIVAKSNLTCSTDNSEEGKKLIERFIPKLERQCESPTRNYGLAIGIAVTVTGCMCFMVMGIFCIRRRTKRNDTTDTTLDTEHTDSGSAYCPMLHTSDQLGLLSDPSVLSAHDTTAAANSRLGGD